MSEEQTEESESTESETSEDNTDKGSEQQTDNKSVDAKSITTENKELEAALDKRELLLKRQQELNAIETYGGNTAAGVKPKTTKDKARELSKYVMAQHGYDHLEESEAALKPVEF